MDESVQIDSMDLVELQKATIARLQWDLTVEQAKVMSLQRTLAGSTGEGQ